MMSAAAPIVRGRRWAPPLEGIRPYRRSWLFNDIVAGVTLAALAIPETMGYTKIAGMPVITGLYTILLPIVAFALVGSSRHLVVGADSATAAIMFAGISALGISGLQPASPQWVGLASLSALLCGGLLFLARAAKLGFLANFLSRTVLIGFLTGVGVQVAIGQVGGMFGVPAQHVESGAFSGDVRKFALTLGHIGEGSWQTALVSAAVLVILLVFGRGIKAIPGGLVAVVGAIVFSAIFDFSSHHISTLGPVPSGLPHIGVPGHVTFSDIGQLMAVAISMFLVILAQSAATSRAYSVKYNEHFEENNDLIGLSLANLAAGFSSTFVVNGSPTKTEMVDEAKSHTQVAQLTMAAVVAVVLLFLTAPLEYLPNCVLSTVVFLIGMKLIDIPGMRNVYRLRRDEFWVALLTAAFVIAVGVEQGIILALLLSLVLHVRRHYQTVDVVITRNDRGELTTVPPEPGARTEPGLVVYRFGAGVFYANAERLSEETMALVDVDKAPRWLILDCATIDDLDYTGGETLAELADRMEQRGVTLALCEVNTKVRTQLDTFGIAPKIGPKHIFETMQAAVAAFHAAGNRSL
jgi:high affinity sulfate transporter 1